MYFFLLITKTNQFKQIKVEKLFSNTSKYSKPNSGNKNSKYRTIILWKIKSGNDHWKLNWKFKQKTSQKIDIKSHRKSPELNNL